MLPPSKYAAGSITYLVTVTPIASNLTWDDSALLSGEHTLAYGEALTVTATGGNSAGAVTYTAAGGAATIVSTTGVITTVATGTATITATQAAAGNYTTTTVEFELTVTAASVSLTWDDAGAVSGVVGASFDAGSYQSQVNSGAVTGTTVYTVDPGSTAGVVTVTSDTGIVTFDKAGQVRIIATFTPNDNIYAVSTTGYDLVISKGSGSSLSAGNDRVENYVANGTFTQAAQGVNPGATVTYQTESDTVATVVAGTGEVTIEGVGVTRITATAAATDQYKSDQSSYQLTVVAVNTDLVWDDTDAANGRVVREAADGTVDIPAIKTLGTGAITYTIMGDATVASIANPALSAVTIHKAGAVKVVATQAADSNYLATSVSYDLLIGESAPNFTWTTPGTTPIEYTPGVTDNPIAESSNSDGDVVYESSNAQVADINKTTGVINIYHAGTATISALLSPSSDGKYTGASIEYALKVDKAATNTTLSFHGVTAGGTVTRNFGEADFVIAAVSTSDSEGAITYVSSESGVATVNMNTGLVSIVGKGSTVITAEQAAGTNYPPGTISYTLTVNAIAATITWTAPAGAATGTVVATEGDAAFATMATSNASGAVFTYTSSETGVADIAGDQVTVKAAGTTVITASHPATGNYTTTESTYTLVVNAAGSSSSDLAWNDSGTIVEGRVTKEFGVDTEYSITASSSNNTSGAVTYEIVGDSNIATIVASSTDAGTVMLGSKAGLVTVVATQAGDGTYIETRIEYLLQVTQNQSPNLVWDTAPAATVMATYGDTTPIIHTASSSSPGTVTYSSSNSSIAAVNELDGVVTLVGAGVTTITATLPATNNYIGGSLSYNIDVAPATSTADTVFKWSSGVVNGGGVNFAFDATVPHISAIAPDPAAVITYVSSLAAEVDVSPTTGALTVNSITTAPVTITASYPATSKYAAGTLTYTVTVTPVISDVAWVDHSLSTGAAILYTGQTLDASATASEGGAITYSSDATGIATINSTTGLVSAVAVGTATITASQAASGNYAATTLTFSLEVKAPAAVTLTWSDADAVAGSVSKTFDVGSFVSVVTPTEPVAGSVAYTVSGGNPAVTVSLLSGLVTFVSVATVDIIATFTPNDPAYAVTTAQYSLTITQGTGIPVSAGSDRSVTTGTVFVQAATGGNGGVITYAVSAEPDGSTIAQVTNQSTGEIEALAEGITTITVTEAATTNYAGSSDSYTLTITQAPMVITGTSGTEVVLKGATERFEALLTANRETVAWELVGQDASSFTLLDNQNSTAVVSLPLQFNTERAGYSVDVVATDKIGAVKAILPIVISITTAAFEPAVIDSETGTFMHETGLELNQSDSIDYCTSWGEDGFAWSAPVPDDYLSALALLDGDPAAMRAVLGETTRFGYWTNEVIDADSGSIFDSSAGVIVLTDPTLPDYGAVCKSTARVVN